jgi:hypothetical protein
MPEASVDVIPRHGTAEDDVGAAAQARERVIDAPKEEGPKVELPPGAERE